MQKISSCFIVVMLVLSSFEAMAQATTNSPYSRFGIGIIRPEVTNQSFGLAGTNVGLRSFNNLNMYNPASYSELSITTFEVAATNTALTLSDGKQKQFENNPYINYLALGFPVVKDVWGMAFGAMPYSNVGYDYSTVSKDSIAGGVSYYYRGDGGLTKVFLGNAFKIKLDSTSSISAGHNLGFLFGNFNYDKKVIYGGLSNSFNLWQVNNNHVADFTSDFGLQYQKVFKNAKAEKYLLTIGATYALAADLKTKKSELTRTFNGNIDFGALKDTLSFSEDVAGVTELPAKIGGGITFEKEFKWVVALDVKTTSWSQIQSSERNVSLKDNVSVSVGYEIIPKHDAFNNYFKRVKYKFGARYSTAYLSINNQDITEYGITFGLGLPLKRTDTSVPGLNLGVEYGNRGVESNGLVKETFVNLYIGLTINDRWFIKRKYD
jgi:hypothetical protein